MIPGGTVQGIAKITPNYGYQDAQLGVLTDPTKGLSPVGELPQETDLQAQTPYEAGQQTYTLTPIERVSARLISTERSLEPWKRKNYEIRRIVAGDFSFVMGDGASAAQDGPDMEQNFMREFYTFIVTSYTEGRSNKLMQAVKTLMQQVSYTFPEIEASDMDAMETEFHAGWCKERLGSSAKGCNANEEHGMALLDYLCGGLGWVKDCWRDRPDAQFCDSLDMKWDRSATTFSRMRWASCTFREPLHVWMEMFPSYDWSQEAGSAMLDPKMMEQLDTIMEVEFYYDVEGDAGSYYAILKTEGYEADGVLDSGPNPYYVAEQDQRRPFIPYEAMYFMKLPSVAAPMGVVEMMLPDQIALWEVENTIRKTVKRGVPYFDVEEGAYEGEARKQLEEGEIAALVERKAGKAPVQRIAGLDITQTTAEWGKEKEQAIKEHSGINPYSSGTPQDVNYAREVDEIAGQSGLTTGTVSKDYAAFWERSIKKLVAIGALYDDLPMTIQLEGVALQFGPSEPASKYLIPDATFIIREDTMMYRPRQQRIAEAMQDLQLAMKLQGVFPNALPLAYEDYLRAKGEQNIAKWLQTAPPPMAPGNGAPAAGPAGQPAGPGTQQGKPVTGQRPQTSVPPPAQLGTPQSAVATSGAPQ